MQKLFWIVGASSGIGRALALKLAQQGHRIAASARNAEKLEALVADAPEGRISAYPLDVSDEPAIGATLEKIEDDMGPLDGMVYLAGFWKLAALDQLDTKLFREHFEINLFASITTALAVFTRMASRGRGQIALVSSVAGFRGIPGAAPYGASKAAETHFAEAIYPEAKDAGVKVQVIHPGFVDTPMTRSNPFSMPFIISADEAAERIAEGLKKDRFEITFPKRMAFVMYRQRGMPYHLYFKVMRKPVRADDA